MENKKGEAEKKTRRGVMMNLRRLHSTPLFLLGGVSIGEGRGFFCLIKGVEGCDVQSFVHPALRSVDKDTEHVVTYRVHCVYLVPSACTQLSGI